jgi:hypothetical protein
MAYNEAALLAAMEELPPLRLVPRDTAEWDYMWELLSLHPLNHGRASPTVCFNEEFSEVWQYMGSAEVGGVWVHQFRHRMHPGSGQREYLSVPATLAFAGEAEVE